MISIGRFISSPKYGPAKIIGREGSSYKIEFFLSPWNRRQVVATLNRPEYLQLYEQTRVYVERNGNWNMGRISLCHKRDDGGYDYDVQYPNRQIRRHPEEDLYCRCWLAHDDPTTALALGGMETQYWHEHRQRLTGTLLAQRAACRGLSAILSSRIEFVPHQLDVVCRVLEDPMQRYLLADEVGMGKTVEAGLVIRQFLLSHSQGNVFVLVPPSIEDQWRQELEEKFLIEEFPNRVSVRPINSMGDLVQENIAFLVVDEAHHLVAESIPESLQRIAKLSQRILLLSATPSLGKPVVLLRLLKLLDPDCYAEVTLDDFSERVQKREELGIFLRGLRVDANPAILRQRLRRLPELFPDDSEVVRLGANVASTLEGGDILALRRSIRALRGYVADVHRIHHRLIRNRRRDAADWVFRPRGPVVKIGDEPDLGHVRMSWVDDSRQEAVFDVFEQWRIQMASSHAPGSPERIALTGSVVALFEAIGCGIDCLPNALSKVPTHFIDEVWRKNFTDAIQQTNSEKPRSEKIAIDLQRHINALRLTVSDRSPKLVIFGSDIQDLQACASALGHLIGNEKVLLASGIENGEGVANTFAFDNKLQALFCSRHEEEGLNLHFADALVHLDLPFSPSRVEQRIGRLDRFGRSRSPLEQRVIFPSVDEELNLWEAWFDVLAQAFYIFNEPIADVQFSLESITKELADSLLDQGATGLRNAISKVRVVLAQERERLDNQYALDLVLQEDDAVRDIFSALDDLEADELEIAEATKGWIADSLQLSCKGDFRRIFRFGWDEDRTLLPVWPWAALLRPGLAGSHTFLRRYALHGSHEKPPQLLRIGSCLIRAIEREYRWDDRGTAFSTWRQLLERGQEEWIAFKLCYVIEGRLPDALSSDERSSLQARLDGYLPPWRDVIYVDAELKPITDAEHISLLSKPYKGTETRGLDFNLSSRQEALFGFVDPTHFERLCYSIRDASEAWLREQDRFKSVVKEAYERGLLDIEHRRARLNQRRSNLSISGELEDSGLTRELELNQKILETLGDPVVKLDSIGVIVLSGRSPDEFLGAHSCPN